MQRQYAAFDLKGEREKRQLSQTAAAEILCSTQASVSRWEASGNMPGVFRKVWIQHWKLIEVANDDAKRQSDTHAARPKRRRNKAGKSKTRTRERKRGIQEHSAARGTALSVPVDLSTDEH